MFLTLDKLRNCTCSGHYSAAKIRATFNASRTNGMSRYGGYSICHKIAKNVAGVTYMLRRETSGAKSGKCLK